MSESGDSSRNIKAKHSDPWKEKRKLLLSKNSFKSVTTKRNII